MSRFRRFFGIFGIMFACIFGARSVAASTSVTFNCNGHGTSVTVQNPTTTSCSCDDAMNMSSGSIWGTTCTNCYILPDAGEGDAHNCAAQSGYELVGWQLGETLRMFKPGDTVSLDEAGLTSWPLKAIWAETNKTFKIKTTTLSSGSVFQIKIAAEGTYRIDWGDGTVQTYTQSTSNQTTYSHTYTSSGVRYIGISGAARRKERVYSDTYPVIAFSDTSKIAQIYGSLGAIFNSSWAHTFWLTASDQDPSYQGLFENATNLTGPIPAELFVGSPRPWGDGIHESADLGKFKRTFYGCSNLTGDIPEHLFGSGVFETHSHNSAFEETFSGCSKLGTGSGATGAIPESLFCPANAERAGTFRLFRHTFNGCHGLSGSIPANLFRCITYASDQLFDGTFKYAWNLSGSIPPNLFRFMSVDNVGGGGFYDRVFYETFAGCDKLTGIIPLDSLGSLFINATENGTDNMKDTFNGATKICTSCNNTTQCPWGASNNTVYGSWTNGNGGNVVTCGPGSGSSLSPIAITLNKNYGSGGTAGPIYQLYQEGWSLNQNGPFNNSLSVTTPTQTSNLNYIFAGYYSVDNYTETPHDIWWYTTGYTNHEYMDIATLIRPTGSWTLRINNSGQLVTTTPNIQSDTTWHAVWVVDCAGQVTNGTCSTTVTTDGRVKFDVTCNNGYELNDDGSACVPSASIYTFTLNKHDGTGGANGPLYESRNVGWSLSDNGSFVSSLNFSVPSRSGYRFLGYCPEAGNTVSTSGGPYVVQESGGVGNCFVNSDGDVVAPSTYSNDGALHGFWARECTSVANGTCTLRINTGMAQQSTNTRGGEQSDRGGQQQSSGIDNRSFFVTYDTSCNTGYHYSSGEGTYHPVCVPDTHMISLNSNGATSNGTQWLTSVYATRIMRPDDSPMTTSTNPISVPQRVFNIQYNAGGTDVTLTVTEVNTTATATFNGYYATATSTSNSDKYIGNTGYITSNGLAVGKQYMDDATWYAKWSGGTITLPSPTRPGYNFAGWYTESEAGNRVGGAGAAYTPASNGTLYARWTAKVLEITLHDNGGSGGLVGVSGANCTKAGLRYAEAWYNACGTQRGALHLYQIPTYANHVFMGYYTGSEYGVKVVDAEGNFLDSALTAYTENGQMFAHWTPVYTIQLDRNGGNGGLTALYEAYGVGFAMNTGGNYTVPFTIPAGSLPTRTGYTFNGYWTSNGVQKIPASGYISNAKLFDSSMTLEAYWTPNMFNITLNDNCGSGGCTVSGLVGVANQNCNYVGLKYDTEWYNACAVTGDEGSGIRGNVALYQVPSRSGFVFNGYYTPDGTVQIVDQYGNFNLNQNALTAFSAAGTIYASWTQEVPNASVYEIILDPNNGLGGTGRSNIYEKENVGWYSDSAAEHLIYASIFDTVANGGAGISQPTAPSNKVFDGYWTTQSVGGERVTDNAGFIVHNPDFNAKRSLYARWNDVAISTTVTLNPNGGTPCATTSVTATYGAAMPTLNCHPDRTGYEFAGYFQNASSVSPGMQYYNGDLSSANNWNQNNSTATIYAQWSPKSYKVAYKCTTGGATSVQEDATYNDEYTVLSFADANCTVPQNKAFVGWQSSINNEIYQPGDTFMYLFDSSLTFTATYTDSFAITLSASGATNSPAPTTVYLNPGANGGWYRNAALTQSISVMDTSPQMAGMVFDGYWTTSSGTGVQIIDGNGNFKTTSGALTAYNAPGTAYARWITPTAQFTVTTTPISANTTFTFKISASGNFVVDWGDGSQPDIITKNDTYIQSISHIYTTASTTGYQIGISGLATGYANSGLVPSIMFGSYYNATTPGLVGGISGSLGEIFPTLGANVGQIPSFMATFLQCSNMTGSIPANLFSGVTGSVEYMFDSTFQGCTGLTGSIPANLFSGVTGSAEHMFSGTFSGCSGLTGSIPANLFSGVTGSAEHMFSGTFSGCSGLTGSIPANLFSGVTGSAAGMFVRTFQQCVGLSGTLPTGLFSHITGAAYEMFEGTFYSTGFTGYIPPTMFSGLTNQSPIPDANDFMANIFGGTGLSQWCPGGMVKYEPYPLADYWAPKVSCVEGPAYHIALDNNGGDTTGTTDIYEKYGTGWALSADPVSWTNSLTITKPTKSGYTFAGYYDDWGNMIINSNGSVVVSNTQFDTYSSNSSNPDATLYAQWNQIAADFTITTIPLSDGDSFGVGITASGTFTIDCGASDATLTVSGSSFTRDGATITHSDADGEVFAVCFYPTGGAKTISLAGTATGYATTSSAIRFYSNNGLDAGHIASVSGSLSTLFPYISGNAANGRQPRFGNTFYNAVNLHSVPNTLFSGYTRGSTYMFSGTFDGSGLTSVPSGLFSSITTGANSMFESTFSNCTGLTGSNVIPSNLFGGITVGAEGMFSNTFYGCTGLTGVPAGLFSNITTGADTLFGFTFAHTGLTSIPADLFAGIHSGAQYMFAGTFAGCSGLTNTIPAGLFNRITSASTGMFGATFRGCTNLTGVAGDLFAGITSTAGATSLFEQTFSACSSLHSVPNTLFSRISGIPAANMFTGTFAASGSVTGGTPGLLVGGETGSCGLTVLPTGLFAGLNGAPAAGVFQETFAGCSDMVGELTPNMFGNIHGSQASNAFAGTFGGCSSLTGFVPPALFEISVLTPTNPATTDFMSQVFNGATSMDTSCPTGYVVHTTGFENYWGNGNSGTVVSCEEQNTYTINLNDGDGNGGSGVVYWKPNIGYSLSQNGTFNFNQSVLAPSLVGYDFAGYWSQAGGTGTQVFNNLGNATNNQPDVPISGMELILYAAWTPKILTITLNDAGATTSAVPQVVYLKYEDGFYANSSATGSSMSGIQSPSKTGFEFGGYYSGENGTGDLIINTSGNFVSSATTFTTQNTQIYAKWTAQQFDIHYVYNGGYEVQSPFVPVEYVSANGNSYFDSGLNISQTHEIRSRFSRLTNNTTYLYGTQSGGVTSAQVHANIGSGGTWRWGSSGYKSISITVNTMYNSIANYAGITLNGTNNSLTSGTNNNFTTPQTLAIGASKTSSNAFTGGFKGNIYEFEVTNGTDVLFNGIPVCNNLTGKCGLLDVSNPLYPEFKVSEVENSDFGSGDISLPGHYTAGTATTITGRPVRAHSDFVGWCTNQNLTANSCSLSPTIAANATGLKTFYAKWQCRTGYTDNGNNECVADTYTISFDGNGGNGGQVGIPLTTNYWTALPTINTTQPVKTGYTFMGWYDNADYTASGAIKYYNANGTAQYPAWDKAQSGTLYAAWAPNVVTVRLYTQIGSSSTLDTTIYEKYADGWYSDYATTPPTISEVVVPTRSGYTFRGYYTSQQPDLTASGGSGTRWITNALTNNLPSSTSFATGTINLRSAWAKDCPDLGNTGTCSLVVNNDGTVTYTTSCSAGYREINANTANVTCTQQYTLTYTCGDGATGTVPAPNPVEIAKADTHTFKSGGACNKTGHTFAGWHVDIIANSLYQPNATLTWNYEQDSDIIAQYTPNSYQITYSCGSGSWTNTAPAVQSVDYGDTDVPLQPTTICTRPGYYADGWDVSGTDPVENYSGTISEWLYDTNKTLTAKWLPDTFTISLLHTDTGITLTGTPNPLYLKYSDGWYRSSSANISSAISQLDQTPLRTGYEFDGYYYNSTQIIDSTGLIQPNTNTFTTSNTSLTPHWSVKTYNITYDLYGGTNYVGAPTEYTYGTTVTINGTPTRDNATFAGWCPVVNNVIQTNNCAMTQTIGTTDYGDKKYAATWTCNAGYTNSNNNVCEANTIYVTLKKNGGTGTCGGASATNDGTLTCTYGQSCVLPAWDSTTCNITNGKKVFVGWNLLADGTGTNYGPGADVQSALPTTGTMTVYAKWVAADCQTGTGVSGTTVNSVINNAPVCNVTCSADYSQAGGATNIQSFTATGTPGIATYTPTCQLKTQYTITVSKNGGTGRLTVNGTTKNSTTSVTATCRYGNTLSLPTWQAGSSSPNNITKTNNTFVGWGTNTTNPYEHTCVADATVLAQWDTCGCGTDTNATCTGDGVTDNMCYYTHVCSDGYYYANNNTSITSNSVTCAQCTAGNYCPTNATTPTPCPSGYESVAGSDEQTDCYITVTAGHYIDAVGQTSSNWKTCAAGKYKAQHTVYYNSTSTACSNTNNNVYNTGCGTNNTGSVCSNDYSGGVCATNASATAPAAYCTCNTGYTINGEYNGNTHSPTDLAGESCAKKAIKISYNLNGGSGTTPSDTTCTYDTACTLTQMNVKTFTYGGKKLIGWATSSGATTATYTTSGTFTADTTLYAVWTDCLAGTYHPTTLNSVAANACQNAGEGYFVATNAATTQTVCAAGSYTNAAGQSACTACQNGKTNTGSGAANRQSCATTCSNANATYVNAWKTATWTNNSVTNACAIDECKGASYLNSNACTECPTGYLDDTSVGKTLITQCAMSVPENNYVAEAHDPAPTPCESGFTNAPETVNYGGTSVCDANTTTVQFVANDSNATGTCTSVTCGYGDTCTARAWNSTNCNFANTNKVLTGWNTEANGTGTSYALGGDISNINTGGTKTLYAVWSNAVCQSGGTGVASTSFSEVIGNVVSCEVNCSANYSRNGGTDTTSHFLSFGGTDVAVYQPACQIKNSYQLTVSKNGGSGTLTVGGVTATGGNSAVVTCYHGNTVTLPTWSSTTGSANNITKTGNVFAGWSGGNSYTCNSGGTVTANWTSCGCGTDTHATCTVSGVANNVCQYTHTCDLGYYHASNNTAISSDTLTCSQCTAGNYCPLNATTPEQCPLGYRDGGTGFSAQNQCVANCSAGTQVAEVNAACSTPSGSWYTPAVHTVNYGSTSGVNIHTCATDYSTPTDTIATSHDAQSDCTRTITLKKNGGSGTIQGTSEGSDATIICSEGTACDFGTTINVLSQQGYTFSGGWGTSATCTGATTSFNPPTSDTYYACKSANCNAITLDPNGGTSGSVTTLYKKTGVTTWYKNSTCTTTYSTTTNIVPNRGNYKLRGFYTNQLSDITVNKTTPTRYIQHTGATTTTGNNWTIDGPATLYAAWATPCTTPEHGTCSVTISGNSTTYTASCDTGYTVASANTATPSCNANTYTIDYTLNGGDYGINHPMSGTYDSVLAIDTPTRSHSTFTGWTVSGMDAVEHYYGETNPPTSTTTNATLNTGTADKYFKNLRSTSGSVTFVASWTCDTGYTSNVSGTACNVDTYNLNWTCGSGNGTMSGQSTIDFGDTLTFPQNTGCSKTGYTFGGWVINANSAAGSFDPGDTYTWNIATGSDIIATYNPINYTISYSCGDGATGTVASQTVDYNASITLRSTGACTKSGYVTGEWYRSDDPNITFVSGATVTHWDVAQNVTLVAQWTPQHYDITYELNGGTQASSGVPSTYTYGTGATISGVPTALHATFAGWCENNGLTQGCATPKTIGSTSTGDKTLFAKWTCNAGYVPNDIWTQASINVNSFDVREFVSNGSTTPRMYPDTTPCIPARYLINCDGNGGVACPEQIIPQTNGAVHLGQYYDVSRLILYYTGGAAGVAATGTFATGLTLVKQSNAATVQSYIDDYEGREVFANSNPNYYLWAHDGNNYLSSWFDAEWNNLTNATYENRMSDLATTYNSPAFGRAHYTFNGLWDSPTLGTGNQFISPTSTNFAYNDRNVATFFEGSGQNVTVYAQWVPDIYTITLDANKGGDTSGTAGVAAVYEKYETGWATSYNGTYTPNLTLAAAQMPTRTGYTFAGWYDDATNGTIQIPATGVLPVNSTFGASTTLYAHWTANTYDVTYDCNGPTGGPTTYNNDATYDSNYTPKTLATVGCGSYPGHTFHGWTVSGTSSTVQPGVAFLWQYTQAKTLTASWTDDKYIITFNQNSPTTSGTSAVQEWYNHGYSVYNPGGSSSTDWGLTTITLPQKTGYVFGGYYDNSGFTGSSVMSDATLPSNTYFTADTTLYAKWTQCAYTTGANSTATYQSTNASNQCVYTVTCDAGFSQNGGTDSTTTFTATGAAGVGTGTLPGCDARTYDINYNLNGGIDVPDGYIPVEYIQGDGNQYITTSYYANPNTRVFADYQLTELPGSSYSRYMFGNWSTTAGDLCFMAGARYNATKWTECSYDAVPSSSPHLSDQAPDLDRHQFVISGADHVESWTDVTFPALSATKVATQTSTNPMTIFVSYAQRATKSNRSKMKLYGFNIYENGTPQFIGIPVRQTSTNKCGLLDISDPQNPVFYDSATSTAFTCPSTTTKPTTYTHGTETTIKWVPARENATFVGWCPVVNGVQSNDCVQDPTILATEYGDKTFGAKWTCDAGYTDVNNVCVPNTIRINYSSTYGTAPAYQDCTYNSSVQLRPAITDATAQVFNGWNSANNNSFGSGDTIVCNNHNLGVTSGSTTMTAQWTVCSCGNDTNATCSPNGVVNNVCQYVHTCSLGYYHTNNGATVTDNSLTCNICTAGNYCLAGATAPTQCPAGYRDGGTGLSAQAQCPMNVPQDYYIAAQYASSATQCADGYSNESETLTYGQTSTCDVNEYTITYDLNQGNSTSAPLHGPTHPGTYTVEDTITISNPTMTGYTFGGWTVTTAPTEWGTNSSNSGDTDFTIAAGTYGNIVLTATWTAVSYNINYEFNGGYDPRNISGYTPVDYIASDGANYIDLGFPAKIQRDWAEITFKRLENLDTALFGNYNDTATGYNFILLSGQTSGTKPSTRSNTNATVSMDGYLNSTNWYTLSLDGRNAIIRNYYPSNSKAFTVKGDYTTGHNMPLFARNNNGEIGNFSKIQLRGFTLYRGADVNGVNYSLKLRGIPMKRDLDGVCGLYDLVENTFMESAVSEHPLTCPNTVSYPSTYTHGVETTVASAPTREHSRFVGWCTDSTLTNCGDPITIPATATENITLYAKWECNYGFVASGDSCVANQYTITLDNGYATTNGSAEIYAIHQSGAYLDNAHTTLMTTSTNGITKPVRQYTVTYDAASGTVASETATANYTFKGYYNSASGSTQYIGSTGRIVYSYGIKYARRYSANVTWYAQWTAASVTLPTPSRPGYVFDGWYTNSGTLIGGAGDSYTPTANITLTAHWTQCAHTAGANSTISATTTNASNQCVYTIACDTGYSQLGGSDSTTSFDITAETGVVTGNLAGCEIRTFTVSYSCGDDTTGDAPANDTVTYGTQPTLPSTTGTCAKVGHTLSGWRIDGTDTDWNNGTSTWQYTEDKTFTVHWTVDTYDITFNSNNATSTGTTALQVKYGVGYVEPNPGGSSSTIWQPTYTITVPTKTGYVFDGYYDNPTFTGNPVVTYDGAMPANTYFEQDTTLHAKWTQCVCGNDTNATCSPNGVVNNVCQYVHTCTLGAYHVDNGSTITSNSLSCTLCSAGSYCPLGATDETPCPTGYIYNTDLGKSAISQCQIHCDGGSFVSGYTTLEYIQTDGNQYIDTGFVPNADYTHKMVFSLAATPSSEVYVCSTGSTNGRSGNVRVNSSKKLNGIYIGTSSAKSILSGTPSLLSTANTIILNLRNNAVSEAYLNGTKISNNTVSTITSTQTLKLAPSAAIKIYGDTIIQNGKVIHDFIPVRRNSDGELGLYDMITGVFKTAQGTGTFGSGLPVTGGQCTNVGNGYYAPASVINYGSTGTRNACAAGLTTIGYGHGADSANDCGHEFHIGEHVVYMRSNKETTPSLNMRSTNGDMFYISLSKTDHNLSKFHMRGDNNVQYTAYDDSLYYGERTMN